MGEQAHAPNLNLWTDFIFGKAKFMSSKFAAKISGSGAVWLPKTETDRHRYTHTLLLLLCRLGKFRYSKDLCIYSLLTITTLTIPFNGVPGDVLKLLEDNSLTLVAQLINDINETGPVISLKLQ
jgi:hypothetical protein